MKITPDKLVSITQRENCTEGSSPSASGWHRPPSPLLTNVTTREKKGAPRATRQGDPTFSTVHAASLLYQDNEPGGGSQETKPQVYVHPSLSGWKGEDPLTGGLLQGEFHLWKHQDVKALAASQDEEKLGDTLDDSRDLIGLYAHEGGKEDPYAFRVDLRDLKYGAENGGVDVYLLVSFDGGSREGSRALPDGVNGETDTPWQFSVGIYDVQNHRVQDSQGNVVQGAVKVVGFDSSLDAIQFAIDKEALRKAGWKDGQPLSLQAFTTKDFSKAVTDAVTGSNSRQTCISAGKGHLAGSVRTTDSVGKAKVAFLWHGNQALTRKEIVQKLIDGKDGSGYTKLLDTIEKWNVPVDLHLSGTLQDNFQWADPSFLERIKGLVQKGLVRLSGGVYAEHLMPFFQGEVNTASLERGRELVKDLGEKKITVAWPPERVINSAVMEDMRKTGYEATVADYLTQWFPNERSTEYKIHQVNGMKVFFIDHYLQDHTVENSDGGLDLGLRDSFLHSAMSKDQEQIHVGMNDWEFVAGFPFASPSPFPHIPANFERNIRWIASHPWIEVTTLEEALRDDWKGVDHGNGVHLPTQTYLGADKVYDWYYGSPKHESFYDYVPLDRGWDFGGFDDRIKSKKKLGGVSSPGTILHDTWMAIRQAPDNDLKELALLSFMAHIYETAWHDDDPGATHNRISGWERDLAGQIRQNTIITEAAQWAEDVRNGKVSRETTVMKRDLNQDGDDEVILSNDKVFAVFSPVGGRLAFAAVSDPEKGGISLVGAPLTYPLNEGEAEVNPDLEKRNPGRGFHKTSCFRDKGYDDEIYSIDPLSSHTIMAVSPDQKVRKVFTLKDGSNLLEATYNLDPSLESLGVMMGFSPNPNDMLKHGQANLQSHRTSGGIEVNNAQGGKVTLFTGDTKVVSSDRDLPLTEKVEVAGKRSFSFSVSLQR